VEELGAKVHTDIFETRAVVWPSAPPKNPERPERGEKSPKIRERGGEIWARVPI